MDYRKGKSRIADIARELGMTVLTPGNAGYSGAKVTLVIMDELDENGDKKLGADRGAAPK